MITVLAAHGPVTIQDSGWAGQYRSGVSRSGAMDRLALALANSLLGNESGAACIEVPLPPLRLRFDVDLAFAVTGADYEAALDGQALPPYWARDAQAGQVLALNRIRSGSFAYVALAGGVDVPPVLGARSTHLRGGFGGLGGRPLQQGDTIRTGGARTMLPLDGIGALPLPPLPVAGEGDIGLRVLPAGEYELFTEAARATFWQTAWTVSRQSNRAGYRLDGPSLPMSRPAEMRSHGIVPGTIQVPAGGAPIIQLADAATMGGYPKIGTVIEADLWRMAQARPGQALQFVEVGYTDAVAALEELDAHICRCRALIDTTRRAVERLA